MTDIPTFKCEPGCHACCGIAPFNPKEWEAVALEAASRGITARTIPGLTAVIPDPINGNCPFLGADGCTIYDRRPVICRVFGASEAELMRCPKGCRPKKKLTREQTERLVMGR